VIEIFVQALASCGLLVTVCLATWLTTRHFVALESALPPETARHITHACVQRHAKEGERS
jgi:hypothetical protein